MEIVNYSSENSPFLQSEWFKKIEAATHKVLSTLSMGDRKELQELFSAHPELKAKSIYYFLPHLEDASFKKIEAAVS